MKAHWHMKHNNMKLKHCNRTWRETLAYIGEVCLIAVCLFLVALVGELSKNALDTSDQTTVEDDNMLVSVICKIIDNAKTTNKTLDKLEVIRRGNALVVKWQAHAKE